jgi:putative membrane protein insertion efficiency factor
MTSLYERSVMTLHRAYKLTLSPHIGRGCRFLPTCSDYAAEALVAHGPWRGGALTVRRLCRCHPLGGSGYDPVPPLKNPKSRRKGGDFTCES